MLKKYQNFIKLNKSDQCCFYDAEIKQENKKVLIKRIKFKGTWNDILTCKALKIQSKELFFPRLLQMLKQNGSYFLVYERPTNNSLSFCKQVIKPSLQQFYQSINDLLISIKILKNNQPNVYIYPQWIFLNRNSIKICHFQPYFSQNQNKQKSQTSQVHVFMYNIENKILRQNNQRKVQYFKRVRNIHFNLGYIMYHLLTGTLTKYVGHYDDYQDKINQIQKIAKNKITKLTNVILAQIVHKLLHVTDQQYFSKPHAEQLNQLLFDQLFSFISKQNKKFKKQKPEQNKRIVEVSLQKMRMYAKQSKIRIQKKKKSLRPCCIRTYQDEQSPQDKLYNINQFKLIYKKTQAQKDDQKLSQNKQIQGMFKVKELQKIQKYYSTPNRHKINNSCVLPSLFSSNRYINNSDKKFNLSQDRKYHLRQNTKFNLSQDRIFNLSQDRKFNISSNRKFNISQNRKLNLSSHRQQKLLRSVDKAIQTPKTST